MRFALNDELPWPIEANASPCTVRKCVHKERRNYLYQYFIVASRLCTQYTHCVLYAQL